jgi:hypothetical protein
MVMSESLATQDVSPEWLLCCVAGPTLWAGYQLGAVVGGGFSSLIAAALLARAGTINAVATFVTVATALTLVASIIAAEIYRVPGRAAAAATVRPDDGR